MTTPSPMPTPRPMTLPPTRRERTVEQITKELRVALAAMDAAYDAKGDAAGAFAHARNVLKGARLAFLEQSKALKSAEVRYQALEAELKTAKAVSELDVLVADLAALQPAA